MKNTILLNVQKCLMYKKISLEIFKRMESWTLLEIETIAIWRSKKIVLPFDVAAIILAKGTSGINVIFNFLQVRGAGLDRRFVE